MTQARDQDKDYDKPFDEVIDKAQRLLKANPFARLHQKFTCEECLSRQMIETANRFHKTAICEACGHTTDLVRQGCGFLAHFGVPPK